MATQSNSSATTERNWSEMNVKELRAAARDAGVEGRSRMTKTELVAALEQWAATSPAAAPVDVEQHVPVPAAEVALAEELPSSSVDDADADADAEPVVVEATPAKPPRAADLFIDYGPELSAASLRRRVRVMVRDPGTMHVYWAGFQGITAEQWRLEVLGDLGQPLQTVRTEGGVRSAYLHVPVHAVRRIQLHAKADGNWRTVDAVGRPAGAAQSDATWQPVAEVRFDEATDLSMPPAPGTMSSPEVLPSSHAAMR